MKYIQVHYTLKQRFGPARSHLCGCGAPAAEWAYQHTGTPLFDENVGCVYSENLEDYAPMCLSCHNKLDVRLDHLSRIGRIGMAVASATPAMIDHRQDISTLNRTARRSCSCGREFSRIGLGRHQQVSGHKGYENI